MKEVQIGKNTIKKSISDLQEADIAYFSSEKEYFLKLSDCADYLTVTLGEETTLFKKCLKNEVLELFRKEVSEICCSKKAFADYTLLLQQLLILSVDTIKCCENIIADYERLYAQKEKITTNYEKLISEYKKIAQVLFEELEGKERL